MMYEKPHFMRPAYHLGIALHADIVLRNVNLNKKRNTVPQWFMGAAPDALLNTETYLAKRRNKYQH
jgi:hypothetical protein